MLDQTITIRNLELKNRLVMPPMHTGLATEDGRATEALADYYHERAEHSAPGLIIMEHTCITEAGRASKTQLSIAADDRIDDHRKLTDAIHTAGGRVFLQLNHAGAAAQPLQPRDNVSASAVALPLGKLNRGVPRALTKEEIRILQDRFVEAAARAMRAGYDGVEIHSAHGYLLDQFYSPLTNRRTDEYGAQTIENRTRFLRETLSAVRGAIGSDTRCGSAARTTPRAARRRRTPWRHAVCWRRRARICWTSPAACAPTSVPGTRRRATSVR